MRALISSAILFATSTLSFAQTPNFKQYGDWIVKSERNAFEGGANASAFAELTGAAFYISCSRPNTFEFVLIIRQQVQKEEDMIFLSSGTQQIKLIIDGETLPPLTAKVTRNQSYMLRIATTDTEEAHSAARKIAGAKKEIAIGWFKHGDRMYSSNLSSRGSTMASQTAAAECGKPLN